VARESHVLQHELQFLSVMVPIAWANRLAKNHSFISCDNQTNRPSCSPILL